MMKNKISVTELRSNLAYWIDFVRRFKQKLDIAKRNKVVAQISPIQGEEVDYSHILQECAGTVSEKDHPEWKSLEDVLDWVNQSRRKDERY